MLKQDLQNELKAAMFAHDEVKKSTLRMLISAIGYYEIQKGGAGYNASEEDVMAVVQKEAKQRKDAIAQFNDGGRPELAAKEEKELHILQSYLPAQMDEEEIRILVREAVILTGATNQQEIGKVMGALMPKVKGKADGGLVNKIVKEELSS
jgi:uncharacterized protein YqeY